MRSSDADSVHCAPDTEETCSSTSTLTTVPSGCCIVNNGRSASLVGYVNMDVESLPANNTPSKVDWEQTGVKTEKRQRMSSFLDPPRNYIRMMSGGSSQYTGSGPKMDWESIWIAAIIMFILSMQFSLYMASLWPYLSKIDPTTNQTFYGFILAAYSAAQMIVSPILGYWYNRTRRARPVVTVGICCSMAGNIVYMFIEAVPDNRKWIMMTARFLTGLGAASGGTLRAYIAMASTLEHRARAIAIGTAALSLGATAGPAIQTCVTPIGYPGLIVGPFHISQYTAASYVSVIGSVVMLILLYTRFKETYSGVEEGKKKDPYHYVPKYDRLAALLCIFGWFTVFFCRTNSDSVESPYTMAVFNWSGDQTVRYNSIIMACSGVLSFLIYTLVAIYGTKMNERRSIVIGLCMLYGFYVITFPWQFYTGRLSFKTEPAPGTHLTNSTESGGCDSTMEWCHYTPRLPLPVYLAAYPLLSAGLPICNVSISTLFSKILGPRRQGFMQSLMIMAGASARLLGPILITWLFSIFGPRIAWTMTSAIITLCISATVIHYNRLVPLNTKPKLKSGQKIRYDGGSLYRL